jgi:hypothetical protein
MEFAWGPRTVCFMRWALVAAAFLFGIERDLAPFTLEKEKANALASFVPLMWVLEKPMLLILQAVALLGFILYGLGRWPALTLIPGLFVMITTGTLRQSKGDASHSLQIISMCLLAVWAVHAFHGIFRGKRPLEQDITHNRRALLAALLMLAGSYVASGILKLKKSDGRWIQNTPNLAVHMVKSNLSTYYSNPEKPFDDSKARWLAERPTLAKALFTPGLILELGAFLMLWSRRWALGWGLALLGMHGGISWLMSIEFTNHMWLLATLAVIPGITTWGPATQSR